jgi:hypothetical protein
VKGEPIIGIDPELSISDQKIMNVVFKSRNEIMKLEKVYPEILKNHYFWEFMEERSHNPYVNRPSKGFGIEV